MAINLRAKCAGAQTTHLLSRSSAPACCSWSPLHSRNRNQGFRAQGATIELDIQAYETLGSSPKAIRSIRTRTTQRRHAKRKLGKDRVSRGRIRSKFWTARMGRGWAVPRGVGFFAKGFIASSVCSPRRWGVGEEGRLTRTWGDSSW